ncbi:S1 family peptidase [Martelella alba]|uniref:S1 family peptidase n=1 Tax=Martelella alba TaxID=2590451 RepID=UPI0015E84621|nr:serine protease [Martelella alba]
MRILFFILLMTALPAAAAPVNGIPADRCAVVIASRSSIDAVVDYVQDHPQYLYDAVYASANGWYAISSGLLPRLQAPELLQQQKAAGLVPSDAFCSTGERLTDRIWSSDAPAETPGAADLLMAPFDARAFNRSEKCFLQAGLALAGDYTGQLDCAWGNGSQAALERWSARNFSAEPIALHAAMLAVQAYGIFNDDGWTATSIDQYGVSLQLPNAKIHVVNNDEAGITLEDDAGSLRVVLQKDGLSQSVAMHEKLRKVVSASDASPYTLRRDDLWVTSGRAGDTRFYLRSDVEGALARNFLVIAPAEAVSDRAALIIASYRAGPQPDLLPLETGVLLDLVSAMNSLLPDDPAAGDIPPETDMAGQAAGAGSAARSSGSGFYVDEAGDVMTNHHVVDACSSVTVDGKPADIRFVDEGFDLALIRPQAGLSPDAEPLAFSDQPVRLNADVTVAGYPLHGLIDTLNVTRGSVSSLKGVGNDATRLQITAPVQAGNSGGPIVDRYGAVVGVVVAKLDGLYVADTTGDLPQNVNFGIRGSIAQIFANANGINLTHSTTGTPLAPEDLADRLRQATVLVECY